MTPEEIEERYGKDALNMMYDSIMQNPVHELLSKDPNDWEPERSGDIWAIYGKTFSAEWIDEHGDYLGFDTEREAMEYIQKEIK